MFRKAWMGDQMIYWHKKCALFHIYWTYHGELRLTSQREVVKQACDDQLALALQLAGEYKAVGHRAQ